MKLRFLTVLTLLALLLSLLAAQAAPVANEGLLYADVPEAQGEDVEVPEQRPFDLAPPPLFAPNELPEFPAVLQLGVGEKYALGIPGATFISSNRRIAAVKASGVIVAKRVGSAQIDIFLEGEPIGVCGVTVLAAPTEAALSAESLLLNVGETGLLTATLPEGSSSALKWSSSNKRVVTVDQLGQLTAIRGGSATITVKTYNKLTASCVVSVENPPVEVGSAPRIVKKTGSYVKDGYTRPYTYINLKNAIPYVYYHEGAFYEVVRDIERRESNILVITNAYLLNGPIISCGVGYPPIHSASSLRGCFVVDGEGRIGYAPCHVTNDTLLSGEYEFTDAISGQARTGVPACSAVCGFGYFLLNGKEDFTFEKPVESRQRQMLGVKRNGDITLFTLSRDTTSGRGWGWDGNDMVRIVKKHSCVSAYNFDGGRSTESAWRTSTDEGFSRDGAGEKRGFNAYLVFTADNSAPFVGEKKL